MSKESKILLVDDDHDNLRIVGRLLESAGYQIQAVDSGAKGLQALETYQPDLVLLDVNMPGMDGLETIQLIKKRENTAAVVFVTANTDTEDVIRGLDAGALDYISKPFSGMELLARVRAQLRVKKLQDELMVANHKLQDLVEIDDLTGLFNMRSVYQKLDTEIERARRYGHGIAAIMLDMDHFKKVNDNHDHLFGSYVLSEVGKIIRKNIRSMDFGARYGGDEFLICLSQTTLDGAKKFCERLRSILEKNTFQHNGDSINLTASMGMAIITNGQSMMDARSLVRHADRALYESKDKGRNVVTTVEVQDANPDIKGKMQRAQ
ncbi:MAG: diguanylate cyclase [Bdellovibrionales bacterium]|nr:diguanylate cyclase [Bdellovibrionales bacterium]NQZ18164.1 diguanylate cyclase [Bdellovibrionales bacterium]